MSQFYDVYQPLLGGWYGNAVLLEGVEREPGESLLFGTEERRSDGGKGSGGEAGKTEIWATAKGPSAGQVRKDPCSCCPLIS